MNKLLITFLACVLLIGCKENDKEVITNTEYLGSPKYSDIQLRLIPAKFIEKNISFSSDTSSNNNVPQSTVAPSLLTALLESSPTLTELGKNMLTFQPDLSVNWLVNSGLTDSSKYASIYFKIGNSTGLEDYLEKKKISSEKLKGIKLSWIDDQIDEHNLIARDDKHLLIIKTLGSKEEAFRIFNDAIYDSKASFLSHFKSTFDERRNDLDIRVSPNSSIAKIIPNKLLSDVSQNFNGIISFKMEKNALELIIDPLKSILPIDTILEVSNINQQGIISFGTQIDLDKLQLLLSDYDLLDDIEYELKRAGLTYDKLKERSNGAVSLAYLGKKISKIKNITYEFDENFNEIEKVSYTETSSRELNGFIGTDNVSLTKDWLIANNVISKTKNNKFEPTLLSKSEILLDENKITIGDITKNTDTQKAKLLLNLNYSANDWKDLPIENIELIDELESIQLKIEENNRVVIHISFKGDPYNYVQVAENLINP